MEIIEIAGYTEYEKLKIAEQFLIPKQLEENGLGWADITFQKTALQMIINNYTMESGVRNLEREIANIIRKIARKAVKQGLVDPPPGDREADAHTPEGDLKTVRTGESAAGEPAAEQTETPAEVEADAAEKSINGKRKEFRSVVTSRSVQKYLGKIRFQETGVSLVPKPGLAYGLAWTEMGGTLLPVEIALFPGKGELILTGNLGDVMKESAHTALSFLRANAEKLNLPKDFYDSQDIHIHVPEGAIPKDGPSAGITIAAALLSAITGQEIKKGYAMTGEITLTDRLLPVGGVKEKILAAHRNHMTHVLMPELNRKDIDELPREVISALKFVFAEAMIDGLLALFPERAFLDKPEKKEKRARPKVAVPPAPARKKSARS
jgi:ATP-dependent Lon protease